MNLQGVWIPIITPFNNGEIDYDSFKNLIEYYIALGVTGLIPNATTGECPVINDEENKRLISIAVETVNNRVKLFWGAGGNYTEKTVKQIHELNNKKIDGILSVCPYYNRPSQDGIYEHFLKVSESTDLPIIIYNIPYRTGINMTNNTILRLAEKYRRP